MPKAKSKRTWKVWVPFNVEQQLRDDEYICVWEGRAKFLGTTWVPATLTLTKPPRKR